MPRRPLYLCAGLQSSGSTLISWCFLQRQDMDGVLDARFDAIPQVPASLSRPLPWVKFTIACFRFSEVIDYFDAEGWEAKPLLVTRDVRSVFNSLIKKTYGRNGISADDPPLRLRLSRLLEDWTMFRERGWPVLRYEDLANDPVQVLKETCEQLGLEWDEAMNTWPKTPDQIADAGFGNETFVQSRGSTLRQTIEPSLMKVKTANIPPEDLEWIERRFLQFNQAMGYAEHVASEAPLSPARAVPRFENTRRYERLQRKTRISRAIKKLTNSVNVLFPSRKTQGA